MNGMYYAAGGRGRWEEIEKLGHGGQGVTSLVRSKSDELEGVLKLLKKSSDAQARARMHREVASLSSLGPTPARVPRVLDDGTANFEQTGQELYFVMEYIKGNTLDKYVIAKGHLGIEDSVSICKSLLGTIKVGIEAGILHRDLKPENIILRADEPSDAVIVDYGLSFNAEDDDELTKVDERMDNRFMSLPERRAKDGNKRDARSDLTSIVGVFYYCLTGEYPGDLVRADGKPVHRGDKRRIGNWHDSGDWRSRAEMLMDKGFSLDIQQRFQDADSLMRRLDYVLDVTKQQIDGKLDVTEKAKATAQFFRTHDRPTQLQEYKDALVSADNALIQEINSVIRNISNHQFMCGLSKLHSSPVSGSEWPEPLSYGFQIPLFFSTKNDVQCVITYGARANGAEIEIMRRLVIQDHRSQSRPIENPVSSWQSVLFYNLSAGLPPSFVGDFRANFEQAVGDGIDALKNYLFPDS